MWDYDGFVGKAQLYFKRAADHPSADDGVQPIWLLLGLEHLLRAPLAKVHPSLLADPTGEAVMHACGYPGKPGTQPKSIQTKTVIIRLGTIITNFTKERQEEAELLAALRNSEMHSSDSPLEVAHDLWLPRFTRVAVAICDHLGLDPAEFIGQEIIAQGQALVDQEDRKLDHEVQQRIAAAREYFEGLDSEEVTSLRLSPLGLPRVFLKDYSEPKQIVDCPACESDAPLMLRAVRSTNERLVEDEILHDVVYIATSLKCDVCNLELYSTAEVRSAGIRQQHTLTVKEDLAERYGSYYADDYGND